MSTSFRSKIKTVAVFDEVETIENDINGVCCNSDGSKTESTFSSCYTSGGFFQAGTLEEVECPNQGVTGCCCSCSYLNNFDTLVTPQGYANNYVAYDPNIEQGVRDNVTLCQCNSIGGRWYYGTCASLPGTNITTDPETGGASADLRLLCGSNNYGAQIFQDVRTPSACCDSNGNCTNVCTSTDCADLSGVQFGNEPCEFFSCSSGFNRQGQTTNTTENVSSCYELTSVNNEFTYTCSQKTEQSCANSNGYWIAYTNTAPSCNTTSMYPPRRGSGSNLVLPSTIEESNIPRVGTQFQGGLYIGRYYPNGSMIKYRDDDNSLIAEKSENTGNGSKEKSWGLILAYDMMGDLYRKKNKPSTITNSMVKNTEKYSSQLTSMYDGFYNTHGSGTYAGINTSLFRSIRSLKYMGFNDWYVPSIKELGFIFSILNNSFIQGTRIDSLYQNFLVSDFQRNFMSSTLFDMKDRYGLQSLNPVEQIINNKAYLYGQYLNFNDTVSGGRRFVVDRKKNLSTMLVRRFYIQ